MPNLRVASDVGGTFTDSIAYDGETARIAVSKVPTTPANRALGTVEGLKRALAIQEKGGKEVSYVGHGMTTTTNAVIQRNGARTAFITNKGFRDVLLIGRQNRPSLFDIDIVRPEPLVTRELCFTVDGRVNAQGIETIPLDVEGVREIAKSLRTLEVEAVAIMFLHSYANAAHELKAKALLEEALPGIPICASTEIVSEFREFERGSTAVLNAYLRPVMETYLSSLEALLRDEKDGLGLQPGKPIMVMEASGGLMTLDSARTRPVHTVLSGPAGGVVASAHIAEMAGISDIITMDIGGTSTDISLIRNGRPAITRSAKLETVPIRIPVIDINAIGAGGGSIAWIDDGGALRVGPMSAEAIPGPACYGRGGTRPTITDANIVLGRFDSKTKLGGDLTMDLQAAKDAILKHIAEPLKISLTEAAAGILRVAHANIVRGIRTVSVERGYDPRDFALVPFGGAGPMHSTPVARELQMPRILVPPTPGILCALGQLVSDLRHDIVETHMGSYESFVDKAVVAQLNNLVDRGNKLLEQDGVEESARSIELHVDVRYRGQSYELSLTLDDANIDSWKKLPEQFHQAHAQRYGHADRSAPFEVVSFGATAIGHIDAPQLPKLALGKKTPDIAAIAGSRLVFFESADHQAKGVELEACIYRRELLLSGNEIIGPAVIEEISATTVLYPGDHAVVDPSGSLIVDVAL